jgi:hypothetical protein
MNRLSKSQLVQALRKQLQHFDESPDFGDAEAVAAIRKHLLLRIREAEHAAKCGAAVHFEQGHQPVSAFDSKAA